MTRKSRITDELANGFPEWSKVRSDDQSVGKSLLNVIGLELEDLVTTMFRGYKNQFLTTANIDEIDQTYIVSIPSYFNLVDTDQNRESLQFQSYNVSGYRDNKWVELSLIENGSLQDFWYQALPDDTNLVQVISGVNTHIASGLSDDLYLTVINDTLDLANQLYITVDCDDKLIEIDSSNNIIRSKVRIQGTTWKDQEEQEDIVFLFSETKSSFKSWMFIDTISTVDFVNSSQVDVYSHRFNFDYIQDTYESITQQTDRRENFPLFWSLTTTESGFSCLNSNTYTASTATDLLLVPPVLEVLRTWNLHDNDDEPIEVLDIAAVPFQQKLYAVTSSGLLIYDTYQELPTIKGIVNTPGALVDIEFSQDYTQLDNEIEILCLFKRPLKTVIRQSLTITYPDGAVFGILEDGTLVTSDYEIISDRDQLNIRQAAYITPEEYGEYIFTFTVTYRDETTETIRRVLLVDKKQPLKSLDLSHISSDIVGIDVDHLGRVLLLDGSSNIHVVELKYDYAISDSLNSELILRENYDEVKLIKV